jgi:NAD(P)-dependent dehydrogenase (short-subunit alcohol dehydrogenase family)
MAMSDRVLVVGGTRGTGLLTAQLLLERGHRDTVAGCHADQPAQKKHARLAAAGRGRNRENGVNYTIIRVGFLANAPANQRQVEIRQGALPLSFPRRIRRADVAKAFAAALHHPNASRATF